MLRLRFAIATGVILMAAVLAAAPPPTTHYRSIGSAPDYNVGMVTAVNGSTSVVGSLDVKWKSSNRGLGDKIRIVGVDYTILSVDAENELTLTEPYAGATTYTGAYVIARKFQRLRDWEDCLEAVLLCPGVTTASLPVDERVEVGVAYEDAPFLMNSAGERLKLDAVATSAAYDITLTTNPANRHHGVADTGVVLDNTVQGSPAIEIRTPFVTIEWIELHHGGTTDQIYVTGVGASSRIDVHNVIFHDDDQTSNGFRVNDNEAQVLFYNNVLYGLEHGVDVNGLLVASPGWFEFYHNTFFQNVVGLNSTTGSPQNNVIVMNGNLAINNGTDFDAVLPNATFSGNNWSSDLTANQHSPGNSLVDAADVKFNSTVTPIDLHIRRGSIVEDNGGFISAVTGDLDGRTRVTPDIGADESDTSSANPPKILTAKSANDHVLLEWQHADYGPMSVVEIRRHNGAFPIEPSGGTLACSFVSPMPFSSGRCADTLPRVNGTTYYYSAFTYDPGGNYSTEVSVTGTPFDNTVAPPEWSYSTKAATLDPPGVSGPNAFAVSNDNHFHAMQGDNGPSGGEWPLTEWAPYGLPAAVQHRPVILNISGNFTALLGAQDGRVYAVDVTTGKLVWKSEVLGGSIDAAPAALVGNYGASGGGVDKVFVGTSDSSANSLFVLDLFTGATLDWFDDGGQPTNIGAVTGVAVKYPSGPVYFTSDDGTGASNRNVWSISVAGLPSPPTENWSHNPGPIDAGPTLYKNLLFVGSRAGSLIGYNDDGTPPLPLLTQALGDGPLKAPIFPVWPFDTLLVSTSTSVNSVQFTATGGCVGPPCINWGQAVGAGATPVLFVPGTALAYAGNGTGQLYELGISLATPTTAPAVRGWTISASALGAPSFSVSQMMLYVSDTSGKVHGTPWPIP